MNTIKLKKLRVTLLLLVIASSTTACGIASEVINHEDNNQRLLKSGALDSQLTGVYDTYQFKFLDKHKITHQFLRNSNGCRYSALPTLNVNTGAIGEVYDVSDIFEKDNHTYQRSYQNKDVAKLNPSNIDRYTRPEYINGTYSNGNPRIAKGFQPMCNQAWQVSQHVIEIELRKQNINELMAAAKKYDPKLVFETRQVNNNKWQVRYSELGPAPLNGAGGPFQTWLLPIGDTDYTFIFGLGANQDSLQHPQAHAQMQAIFKHLIESVKIEPIKP